ncbi:MAG: MFS transporter [Candidatus Tectomicrobia bacterium]|nr:MFS transporter [Candidatus Tectomicrobia bacterium]
MAFAALHHRDFRWFFTTRMLSMMADSIEHIVSYWAIYKIFHSPALAGFAVISHWLPFLLFSVHAGALADRFDCRRLIQIAQFIFMGVSVGWAALLLTNSLQVWHAAVLLILHGLAGTIWMPASQLIIHEIVGPKHLQSAIRLNATALQLGLLLGPAVGGGLLVALGPSLSLFVNAAIYLPFTLWLQTVPYTGHNPAAQQGPKGGRLGLGLGDAVAIFREVAGNRVILAMILLGGFASLLVGNAYQAQMPEFAHNLGAEDGGLRYSLLLAANAGGAVVGGLLLESGGLLAARARTAVICAGLFSLSVIGFTLVSSYLPALALLFIAGVFSLAFYSMALTLVQIQAPAAIRGGVIGLFNVAQLGLRTFSGVTVGVLGSLIGISWSLGLSAATLFFITVGLLFYLAESARAPGPAEAAAVTEAEGAPAKVGLKA